ncbi:hypothetical protein C0993_010732 [Termitomyces sp. T159_Od127]|nr:hypothetical protein C0993_010732 [Termitomyces sp. T159_Od127]
MPTSGTCLPPLTSTHPPSQRYQQPPAHASGPALVSYTLRSCKYAASVDTMHTIIDIKSKLDTTKSKHAEVFAKLKNQAVFLAGLEAKLKETALELQETQFALDTMDCKKDALMADLRAKLASAKADLKAAEENLLQLTLTKDMELEENNKLKLDVTK